MSQPFPPSIPPLSPAIFWSYVTLVFPLSLVGLPLYLLIPAWYHQRYGLSLTTIGTIQITICTLEALLDPWIGMLSDRFQRSPYTRVHIVWASACILSLSLMGLFNPGYWFELNGLREVEVWLCLCLFCTALTYSIVMINYNAIVLDLPLTLPQKSILISRRELIGLAGFLVATALPGLWQDSAQQGFLLVSACFAWILLLNVTWFHWCFTRVPLSVASQKIPKKRMQPVAQQSESRLDNKCFILLTFLYFLHSTILAITNGTFVFYVEYVIGAPEALSAFLAVYFFSAIVSIYVWQRASQRYGIQRIWPVTGAIAILSMGGGAFLGTGESGFFYGIAAVSGAMLGADFIFPYIWLAGMLPASGISGRISSIWTFCSKFALAMGGGVGMLLIEQYSHVLGGGTIHPDAVRLVYALIPALLKGVWLIVLLLFIQRGRKILLGIF